MEQNGSNFTPTIHHDTYPYVDPTQADLTGKNVLITGGSRGLGRAMAISYAKAGASGIALCARSPLDQVKIEVLGAAASASRSPPKILTIKCDTTKQSDIDAAVGQVTASFAGKLDILINNAGTIDPVVPLIESDPNSWWQTFEVNLKGVYLMTRAFLPLLLSNTAPGDKTIIVTSSLAAYLIATGFSAYQMTKQAVLRLNTSLMFEYGDQGLLAYGIHPGAVPTDMTHGSPPEMASWFVDTPELCGDTLVWLTRERREWLADRYISLTWDMEEFLDKKDEVIEKDLLRPRMTMKVE